MKRRVLNFVTLVSLVLCVTAAGLWAYSWWAVYRFTRLQMAQGSVVHVHDSGSGSLILPLLAAATVILPDRGPWR